MRIVIATPLYPPDIGGPATYAHLLKKALPHFDTDCVVDVVAFSSVRRLPKIIRHVAFCFKLFRAARKAYVLLALDPVSVGLPAYVAARLSGTPYIVKIVGDYAWEQGSQRFGITDPLDVFVLRTRVPIAVRMLRAIQTFVGRHAAQVIVPSNYLKGIITSWGIPATHIQVIYNAVELPERESSSFLPNPKPELAAALTIVTVGRLVPWKRIDGVIDAVAGSGKTATLVVVGDGPDRDALERYGKKVLPGRILWTGALTHGQTRAIVEDADICVLNSTYEGLSHVLIEAQMLGVPTIATDVGGNGEVIQDGETGLLVPVDSPDALRDAIATLCTDTAMREKLGTSAKQHASRFSVETMLRDTRNLLIRYGT